VAKSAPKLRLGVTLDLNGLVAFADMWRSVNNEGTQRRGSGVIESDVSVEPRRR
jgi:hypothetical protein